MKCLGQNFIDNMDVKVEYAKHGMFISDKIIQ